VTRSLRWIERTVWSVGLTGLAIWAGSVAVRHVAAAREVHQFERARETPARAARALPVNAPDTALWDSKRILAWQESQHDASAPPLAVLRIPRLRVEAPVLEGTSDWTLNRGVGHIEDTALPGRDGNVGIAGHRDGFFRALKDVKTGDLLELETHAGVAQYRIERSWIVDPDDVSVLDPTAVPAVTLVTCYPFYFVGSAPQRFIVRAVRTDEMSARAARN
jgi:sortase A